MRFRRAMARLFDRAAGLDLDGGASIAPAVRAREITMTTLIALCNDPVEYSQANGRVRTTNEKTPACEPPAVANVRGARPKSLMIAESRRAFLFGGKRG
jgi:hypothetical protein